MALIDELQSAICTVQYSDGTGPSAHSYRSYSQRYDMADGAFSVAFAHDAKKTVWFRTNSEINLI
jgi:hypothetical protein